MIKVNEIKDDIRIKFTENRKASILRNVEAMMLKKINKKSEEAKIICFKNRGKLSRYFFNFKYVEIFKLSSGLFQNIFYILFYKLKIF